MQRVGYGQHVEERIANVGGEPESLGFQLKPGERLSRDEENPQKQSDIQPPPRIRSLVLILGAARLLRLWAAREL